MRQLVVFLSLAVLLGWTARVHAQPVESVASSEPTSEVPIEGLDGFVADMLEKWKVPGLAIAVVKDGDVILSKGYGYRDVENRLPVTPKTLFAIASVTKSFTVTTLGMLADDGKLDWDKPVRTYLPDFQLHDPVATENMTPRDLVTHRSGLPRHDSLWYAADFGRKEMYDRLRYLEPSEGFRSKYQYQNLMFMTAGYLAGQIAGTTWEELARERILEPLAMQRTNFSVVDSQKSDDFALNYENGDGAIKRVPFRNLDALAPAGAINSCVDDMIRYVQFHLNKGRFGDRQLLSKAMAEQMQTPQMVMPDERKYEEFGHPSYGMGFVINTYRGHEVVRHGGAIDGFRSVISFMPEQHWGMILLSNGGDFNPLPGVVSDYVYDRLLGLEPIDWSARVEKEKADGERKQQEEKAQVLAERRSGTSPSHELGEYVGVYEHPGYGKIEIGSKGSELSLKFHEFTVPLAHYHYDIFEIADNPRDWKEGAKLTFFYNKEGEIDRVAVPLEPAVDDIVFDRVAGTTVWHEVAELGVEGKGWTETKALYDRLPSKAEGVVRDAVWNLSQDSAGMCVRFVTDAPEIHARWTLTSDRLAMPHMPATGVSGLDLYVKHDGRWRWLATGRPDLSPPPAGGGGSGWGGLTNTVRLVGDLPAGSREYLLYLPLYNGVKSVEIGVPSGRTLSKAPPREDGKNKPIVFYGTSITQGGCASRPGMVHTAILGRRLDRPVINLGFSGNGRMEPEMADLLAELDPAVYVLDCLPNMNGQMVSERVAPFVHTLRKAHPQTPILLVEDRNYSDAFLVTSRRQRNEENHAALEKIYAQLVAEGAGNLHYLPGGELLGDDGEATVDGSHPTDLGFVRQADRFQQALEPLLAE